MIELLDSHERRHLGNGKMPDGSEPPAPPLEYKRITSRELATSDYAIDFLIDETMVAQQPLIVGGPHKSLKTSLLIDAAVSLAAAGHFLGKLKVNRVCRVAVMTGESGLGVIQETALRICRAAGQQLENLDSLVWSTDLPKFGLLEHLNALERFITDDETEILAIDPAYLAMPSNDAGDPIEVPADPQLGQTAAGRPEIAACRRLPPRVCRRSLREPDEGVAGDRDGRQPRDRQRPLADCGGKGGAAMRSIYDSGVMARNLRRVMIDRGLTHRDVCRLTGVAGKTLTGILKGQSKPWPATVHKLATALGVPQDVLVLDDTPKPRSVDARFAELVIDKPHLFAHWTATDVAALIQRLSDFQTPYSTFASVSALAAAQSTMQSWTPPPVCRRRPTAPEVETRAPKLPDEATIAAKCERFRQRRPRRMVGVGAVSWTPAMVPDLVA